MAPGEIAATEAQKAALAGLLESIGYEVMPFASAEEGVLAHVPREIPLTVTATGGKGLEPTLQTAISLADRGYAVAPHLPARLVRDAAELHDIVSRFEAAGIDRVFIIGGDAKEPRGEFPDALSLLRALSERGHRFVDVGIGGYPEGHPAVDDAVIAEALSAKAPYATRVLTQICFDAKTIAQWASGVQSDGIDLPIHVGLPAPVSRQKLLRISAGLGLGQSANFLQKQQNMFWKFFSPAGYSPNRLIRGLLRVVPTAARNIRGLHIYTFNDFAQTERWRRDLLAQTGS